MIIYVASIIILIFSAALRALQEIGKWRLSWTYDFLKEGLDYRSEINFDLYHVASTGHWILMFVLGALLSRGSFIQTGLSLVVVYIVFGQVFNVFYHYLFIRPEVRDYVDRVSWVKCLFKWLTGKD